MKILGLTGTEGKEISLPKQFKEDYHPDLIKRVVLSERAAKRQAYGAKDDAGQRSSAKLSRRRKDYKGAYGKGMSRAPRKTMWRRGLQFGWVGAWSPETRGGRKAHPPKSIKNWDLKVNNREKMKAIRSALSATINEEFVKMRNHITPSKFPVILESKIETLNKTKEVSTTLDALGFKEELKRVKPRKIRSGRSRTNKYITKKGPLFVVSKECELTKSAENIRGIEVVPVDNLTAELLAPGAKPGRLTIYSERAIERLQKENLYYPTK